MTLNANRLGRGLGTDILFVSKNADPASAARSLPLSSIEPNPKQPRQDFDQETLNDLAESIRQQGVLQPITVRGIKESLPPRYEIVAGERRWKAAQLAGLSEIPAIIRELTDQEALLIALTENLQRENLNPLEEALAFARLKEEFHLNQESIASMLGKKRSTVANSLRLLQLGDASQKALAQNRISAGHARALLALTDSEAQDALLERILSEQLTVRDSEGLAALNKTPTPLAASDSTPPEPAGAALAKNLKSPQSAIMLSLQSLVSKHLQLPVKISGQESRGKISISYSSREELAVLLKAIGLPKGS